MINNSLENPNRKGKYMNDIDKKIIKIIAALGWILVGLGALFTVLAFILFLRSSNAFSEPIWVVFLSG